MKNYEFDYSEKQIVVSKSFLKEAGIIGSRAYNELAQVRRDYPGYSIVQREVNRKHEKKPYGRLTYKAMQEYIEAQEPEEVVPFVLTEFQRIQALSKSYNAKYAYVKKWFLERYKDVLVREEEAAEA